MSTSARPRCTWPAPSGSVLATDPGRSRFRSMKASAPALSQNATGRARAARGTGPGARPRPRGGRVGPLVRYSNDMRVRADIDNGAVAARGGPEPGVLRPGRRLALQAGRAGPDRGRAVPPPVPGPRTAGRRGLDPLGPGRPPDGAAPHRHRRGRRARAAGPRATHPGRSRQAQRHPHPHHQGPAPPGQGQRGGRRPPDRHRRAVSTTPRSPVRPSTPWCCGAAPCAPITPRTRTGHERTAPDAHAAGTRRRSSPVTEAARYPAPRAIGRSRHHQDVVAAGHAHPARPSGDLHHRRWCCRSSASSSRCRSPTC